MMNKLNYLALGAVALTIISIFSPWLEVSDTANNHDLADSFQPVIISGISIGYGIFGLLVALLGAYLVFKEYKWTFIAGIVNFITGYGYLHQWFGAGSHDSGNYGDVTSKGSVDPKFGIYLFIIAALAFIIFTLKFYKLKKTEPVQLPDPEIKEIHHPVFTIKNPVSTQKYQPSNIQTMTTSSTDKPTEPESAETPKVTETPAVQATEIPTVPEKAEPTVLAQPTVTPKEPVQPTVNEPAPQAPKDTYTPQQQYVEPEKKKSSTTWILLIILVIVLAGSAVFFMTNKTSQNSNDKTEQSINDEKARLDVIINEVNQDVSDKKYDDALLKINSINWLYDPSSNKGYVDQYNSQRENLRNTIEQLKSNKDLDDQKQAAEKANQATPPPAQTSDSIH
jgi:outer membrane biosynthesis protein TonB